MKYSKEMRMKALLTIEEVATLSGVSKHTIGRIEKGVYPLSDKLNTLLVRAVLKNRESYAESHVGSVKEESSAYHTTMNPFSEKLYAQFSQSTKKTISLCELDDIIKKISE